MDLEKGFLNGFFSPRRKRGRSAIFAEMAQLATSEASSLLYEIVACATVVLSTDLIFKQGFPFGVGTLWSLPWLEKLVFSGISGMLRIVVENLLITADPGRLKLAPNLPVCISKGN